MPNPQELIKYYRRYDSSNNVWDYVYLVTSAGAVKETTNRIFVHVSENQFKGVYSPTASYELNDIVKYRPNASAEWRYYIAIQNAFVGQDPSTATTYWSPYDLSKEGSATNSGFFSRAQATKLNSIVAGANKVKSVSQKWSSANEWQSGDAYSEGDVVTYNGKYYICTTSTSVGGANPEVATSNWDCLTGGIYIDNGGGDIFQRVTPVISSVGGNSNYAGVLVQTKSDGKIDTSFIPDSILGSLKYQGTWEAYDGTINWSGTGTYTPAKGDYWICSLAGDCYPQDDPSINAYSNATTYSVGDMVTYGGDIYKSIFDGNINHTPGATGSETYWELMPSPLFQIGDWVICRDVVNGHPIWDEIDNQTKVITVNGRTGNVEIYQGGWVNGTVYHVGDIVWKDNKLQICTNVSGSTYTFTSFSDNILQIERQYLYSYSDTAGQPTFKRIDGNSKVIETIQTDIGSTVSEQNLYTYLVGTVLNITNNDTSFVENTTKNLTIIANFTFNDDNTLGETGNTRRFSNNFKAFLTSNYSNTNSVPLTNNKIAEINKMRIDFVKEFNSSGILKLTLFDNANREYYIDIKKTYNEGSGNTTYTTRGWRVKNIIEDGSTSNITDALEGDICLEDYSA